MKLVVLGLGSNRKFKDLSPVEVLKAACEELNLILNKPVFSSVYKTKAMYVEDQDDFYNMAAAGYVDDNEDPFEYLKKINLIEAKYGRNRENEIRFGPRSLDIDIEIFGNLEIKDPILEIPHPRVQERAFVLIPMLEILPLCADKEVREKYTNSLEVLDQSETKSVVKFCSPVVVKNGTEQS